MERRDRLFQRRRRRAIQLPDGDIESSFLKLFGRPSRDTPYDSERNCDASLRQSLYMFSSDQLQGKDERQQALQDLLWAVLSTKEFMVNH